ncbi:MAG: threonine synthase [Candidatus Micrarchaeia archaeon]
MRYYLKCTKCGRTFESDYRTQVCDRCSGILEVIYARKPALGRNKLSSFWDFMPVLPSGNYRRYEVGLTKIIKSTDLPNTYMKLEIGNPTHSFKDRGSVIEVGKAYDYGYKEIVCASTGNMAYSVAYYAKLYGMKAKIFISNNASKDKVRDIRDTHDADVTRVDGDFTKAQHLAEAYAKRNGAFLAGDYCYRKEGQKTIAYEIILSGISINSMVVPVGNATLLSGTFKAIEEIKASRGSGMPTVIGVEAKECSPLYKAFKGKEVIKYEAPRTKADAIAVGYPTFGDQSLTYMQKYGGAIGVVSESEMANEQHSFTERYGLIAELAAVAPLAYIRHGKGMTKGTKVAVITGANV